jgi:uncharacterized protein YcbK (DUF882 family)
VDREAPLGDKPKPWLNGDMRLGPLPRLVLACAALALAAAPGVAAGDPPKEPASKASAKPKPKTASRAPAKKRGAAEKKKVSPARAWHTPAPGKTAPHDDAGRPMLVLKALNVPEQIALRARGEGGGFAAEDLDRAAHVLRDTRSGNEHPIAPELLDLVYRVQTHFDAQEVRVISGYRTPRRGAGSNHAKGRAIDLVVPGASDVDVARFVRAQGFVGVGIYPTSGFVHVDVRERSYFWIDKSGPGKRSRIRGILGELAKKSDAEAIHRGARAIGPFFFGTDVDAALANTPVAASSAPPIEDDDLDEPLDP